ncbi:hypothetical protein D3C80_1942680 [compost metagenome]
MMKRHGIMRGPRVMSVGRDPRHPAKTTMAIEATNRIRVSVASMTAAVGAPKAAMQAPSAA